jgi:hypothetical protein
MAARGSGLGASIGQGVFGGFTGRPDSPVTTTIYGAQRGRGVAGWSNTPVPHLLGVVAAELLILVALRHGFRHYHGG